jgi:hypothetical protein
MKYSPQKPSVTPSYLKRLFNNPKRGNFQFLLRRERKRIKSALCQIFESILTPQSPFWLLKTLGTKYKGLLCNKASSVFRTSFVLLIFISKDLNSFLWHPWEFSRLDHNKTVKSRKKNFSFVTFITWWWNCYIKRGKNIVEKRLSTFMLMLHCCSLIKWHRCARILLKLVFMSFLQFFKQLWVK